MKQNQKFNSKLIFLGTLLLVITVAFIFASGCIDEDNSSIDMAEVISQQMSNAESQGQILETVSIPVPGGIVQPVEDYSSNYILPPADDSSSYTPPSAPPDIVLTKAPSNEPIRGGYTYATEPAPIEQTTKN